MRLAPIASLALLLAPLACRCATNVLPGLRFAEPPIGLRGSLVFLYSTNRNWSGGQGHIYDLNLQTKRLRIVTTSPCGTFYCARDGKTFCVLHGANVGWGIFGTNAFIYSDQLHVSRNYTFQKRASRVTFGQGHVFFHFDARVFDYDIKAASLKPALLPGEEPPDLAGPGLAVAESTDPGYFGFKASDGRWIFFGGPYAPVTGTKLVSSLYDEFHTRFEDPKRKHVRVLKRFSKPLRGDYSLRQMSPCRRYVLVARSFPMGDDWGFTYYVVSSLDGETRVLLEDAVPKVAKACVSRIEWVDDPQY